MTPDSAQTGVLRLELEAPSEVGVGEPVQMTLRATNTGVQLLDLYLRGREIAFDLSVVREDGEVVWRRLKGRTVPAILQVRTLSPGESLELSDVWDQQMSPGIPAGPGLYVIEGTLPMESGRPKTPAVRLRIL
jgi:hypothetical protein